MIVDLRLTRLQPFSISSRNKIFKMTLDITIIDSERGWRISRKQRKEIMQSELDKIYEEEFEERFKNGIAKAYEEGYAIGYKEGFAIGYKEGFAIGLTEIAKKLKSMGFPIEAISECTGLSISAVQAI